MPWALFADLEIARSHSRDSPLPLSVAFPTKAVEAVISHYQ